LTNKKSTELEKEQANAESEVRLLDEVSDREKARRRQGELKGRHENQMNWGKKSNYVLKKKDPWGL